MLRQSAERKRLLLRSVRIARASIDSVTKVAATTHRAADQATEVLKITTAAFELGASTNLEVILRANNIQRLYVSGVSSSGAVLSAAKDGHDRGYDVFILDDCCCALTEEQHQAVIDQCKRMTTILTSENVTFKEEFQL